MVYLVFSKGGREGGLLPGKKSFNLERNARPNHGMTWKLSLLPGNLWGVCIFFFSEPLQLSYGRGWGSGDSYKDLTVGTSAMLSNFI